MLTMADFEAFATEQLLIKTENTIRHFKIGLESTAKTHPRVHSEHRV